MYWSRSIWTLSSLSADLWNSLSMRLSLFWYSKHSSFSLPRSSVLPLQLRVSVRLFLVSPYLYYILQTKLSPGRKLWHSTAYIFCALILGDNLHLLCGVYCLAYFVKFFVLGGRIYLVPIPHLWEHQKS